MALAATVFWGCQFDTRGYTPQDGAGLDAAPGPDANTDALVQPDGGTGCTNGEQRCLGRTVQLCVDDVWTADNVCDWGCNYFELVYPYCGDPQWAETVNPQTDVGTGMWVAEAGLTVIDTDTGTITTPSGPLAVNFELRLHFRTGGLEAVTIIGFTEITIPVGARVEVHGTQALALVSYGSIIIGGELMAQGLSDGTAGPGGYPGGVDGGPGSGAGGGAPGARKVGLLSGAGGGGSTGVGGVGGTGARLLGSVNGGLGGITSIVDPVDGPLVGGHGGGSSAESTVASYKAPGGGGGGALMLAAQISVEVLATGVVNVGGGGGASSSGAGGGGGSGGMVLIQTHTCVIAGVVAANGGGGGDVNNGSPGDPGSSGDLPTPGGGASAGTGGAGSDLAGGEGSEGPAEFYGGGGGGGAGFIRIDTVLPADIGAGIVSPHETTAGHAQNDLPTN